MKPTLKPIPPSIPKPIPSARPPIPPRELKTPHTTFDPEDDGIWSEIDLLEGDPVHRAMSELADAKQTICAHQVPSAAVLRRASLVAMTDLWFLRSTA